MTKVYSQHFRITDNSLERGALSNWSDQSWTLPNVPCSSQLTMVPRSAVEITMLASLRLCYRPSRANSLLRSPLIAQCPRHGGIHQYQLGFEQYKPTTIAPLLGCAATSGAASATLISFWLRPLLWIAAFQHSTGLISPERAIQNTRGLSLMTALVMESAMLRSSTACQATEFPSEETSMRFKAFYRHEN